jgi:hypothetical protein
MAKENFVDPYDGIMWPKFGPSAKSGRSLMEATKIMMPFTWSNVKSIEHQS